MSFFVMWCCFQLSYVSKIWCNKRYRGLSKDCSPSRKLVAVNLWIFSSKRNFDHLQFTWHIGKVKILSIQRTCDVSSLLNLLHQQLKMQTLISTVIEKWEIFYTVLPTLNPPLPHQDTSNDSWRVRVTANVISLFYSMLLCHTTVSTT